MAVLVIARMGGTLADADRWRERNGSLAQQQGFLFQGDGPIGDGWQVVSAWESREDYARYFDSEVQPHLPPGVDPDAGTEYHELAGVVR